MKIPNKFKVFIDGEEVKLITKIIILSNEIVIQHEESADSINKEEVLEIKNKERVEFISL